MAATVAAAVAVTEESSRRRCGGSDDADDGVKGGDGHIGLAEEHPAQAGAKKEISGWG